MGNPQYIGSSYINTHHNRSSRSLYSAQYRLPNLLPQSLQFKPQVSGPSSRTACAVRAKSHRQLPLPTSRSSNMCLLSHPPAISIHPPSGLSKKIKKLFKKDKKPPKKECPGATATDLLSPLTLNIYSHCIRLYPSVPSIVSDDNLAIPPLTPGNDTLDTTLTCLLRGSLADFLQYSRQEASKWLIDIAHDICDPLNRRGSLVVFKEQQWILVADTDPLTASMYRYDLPPGVTVSLSKISRREGKSVTSLTGSASTLGDCTLANHLRERDGKCWVSRILSPLANSHLVPKRMGDDTAQIIFETFTSLPPPPNLTLSDELFCLSLSLTLDSWFDDYQLGFRFVSPVRSSYPLISTISINQLFRMFMSAICSLIQLMWTTLTKILSGQYLEHFQENTDPTSPPSMGTI